MGFMERLQLRGVVKATGVGLTIARKVTETKAADAAVVANMQAAAEAALAQIAARTAQFESSFKAVPKKTVSEKAAFMQKTLASLDAKYRSLPPATIEARVKELVVLEFFGKLDKLSERDLKSVGLPDDVVKNALALKQERVAEAARKKAESKSEPPKKIGVPPTLSLLGATTGVAVTSKDAKLAVSLDAQGVEPTIAERLGIKPADLNDATVSRINDRLNTDSAKQAEQLRDLLIVFRKEQRALAGIVVDAARINGLPPDALIEALRQTAPLLQAIDLLAMSGKETLEKLQALPELHALLVHAVDEVLVREGPLADNARQLIADPNTNEMLNQLLASPALDKIVGGFTDELGRLGALLGGGRSRG